MSLTTEKREQLEKLWAKGLSCSKIGKEMGYLHLPDTGRNVITGMVKRLRDDARREGRLKDVAFWSRGKVARRKSKKTAVTTTHAKKTGRERSNIDSRRLSANEKRRLIDESPSIRIERPTNEEVTRSWMAAVCAAANGLSR